MSIIIGKNSADNTRICKEAQPDDVLFHVGGGLPSAHLIFKNPDKTPIEILQKQGIIYDCALKLKVKMK